MATTIRTNNRPRDLLSGYELTEAERKELDYIEDIDETFNRFFRYQGQVYDTYEFVRIVPRSKVVGFEHGVDEDSPLLKWAGIQTDSYFSGVVVRYVENFERVVVGVVSC